MRQASGGWQYRATTLADLARLLQAASRPAWWRLVAEFLEEYRWEPVDNRDRLLATEPPSTGDERLDVLLAALAEHLAARDGRGAPPWSESRRLRRSWFPVNTPAARADAVSMRRLHSDVEASLSRPTNWRCVTGAGPRLDRLAIEDAFRRLGDRLSGGVAATTSAPCSAPRPGLGGWRC